MAKGLPAAPAISILLPALLLAWLSFVTHAVSPDSPYDEWQPGSNGDDPEDLDRAAAMVNADGTLEVHQPESLYQAHLEKPATHAKNMMHKHDLGDRHIKARAPDIEEQDDQEQAHVQKAYNSQYRRQRLDEGDDDDYNDDDVQADDGYYGDDDDPQSADESEEQQPKAKDETKKQKQVHGYYGDDDDPQSADESEEQQPKAKDETKKQKQVRLAPFSFRQHVKGTTPTGPIEIGTPAVAVNMIFDTGSDKFVAKTWDSVKKELEKVDAGVVDAVMPKPGALYDHNVSTSYKMMYSSVEGKRVPRQGYIAYGSGMAFTDEGQDVVNFGDKKLGHGLPDFPISEISMDSLTILHSSKAIAGILGLQHMKNKSLGESLYSRLRASGAMTAFGYCRGKDNDGMFLWGDESTEGTGLAVEGQMHWALDLSKVEVPGLKVKPASEKDTDSVFDDYVSDDGTLRDEDDHSEDAEQARTREDQHDKVRKRKHAITARAFSHGSDERWLPDGYGDITPAGSMDPSMYARTARHLPSFLETEIRTHRPIPHHIHLPMERLRSAVQKHASGVAAAYRQRGDSLLQEPQTFNDHFDHVQRAVDVLQQFRGGKVRSTMPTLPQSLETAAGHQHVQSHRHRWYDHVQEADSLVDLDGGDAHGMPPAALVVPHINDFQKAVNDYVHSPAQVIFPVNENEFLDPLRHLQRSAEELSMAQVRGRPQPHHQKQEAKAEEEPNKDEAKGEGSHGHSKLKHQKVDAPSKEFRTCKDHPCVAVIDTGSNIIAMPSAEVKQLTRSLDLETDCSNFDQLPDLHFVLGKHKKIVLPPSAYVMKVNMPGYDNATSDESSAVAGNFLQPDAKESFREHSGGELDARSQHQLNAMIMRVKREYGLDLQMILDVKGDELNLKHARSMCMLAMVPIDRETQMGTLWVVGGPLFEKYYTRWSWKQGEAQPQIFLEDLKQAKACTEDTEATTVSDDSKQEVEQDDDSSGASDTPKMQVLHAEGRPSSRMMRSEVHHRTADEMAVDDDMEDAGEIHIESKKSKHSKKAKKAHLQQKALLSLRELDLEDIRFPHWARDADII